MTQPDCVIIDVKSGHECPMCGNNVTKKNMAKSCSKNIPDHHVCKDCEMQLKSSGFGDGCVYCGYRLEKQKNTIIARAQDVHLNGNNVVIVRHTTRCIITEYTADQFCQLFCFIILITGLFATLYGLGIVMYSIGQSVHHMLAGEDHTHKTEWSLRNCVMGYLGWIITAYIAFQIYLLVSITYEKCCFPCGKKIYSYCKKIYRSQSTNRVAPVE